MLVRKFVNAGFRLLLRAEWEAEIIKAYTEMLAGRGGPLRYDIFLFGEGRS